MRFPIFCGLCLVGGVGIGVLLGFSRREGVVVEETGGEGVAPVEIEDVVVREMSQALAGSFAERFDALIVTKDFDRIGWLLDRWLDIDPMEAAEKLRDENYGGWDFFREWGLRDVDAALAIALSYEGGEEGRRESMLRYVLSGWIKEDPARFLELAAGLPSELVPRDLLKEVFANLAAQDPAAALEMAEVWGAEAMEGVALGWARLDGAAALAWVDNGNENFRAAVVGEWAKVAPLDAMAYLGKLSSPLGDNAMVRSVLGEVAAAGHVAEALRWVQTHAVTRGAFLVDRVIANAEGSPEELWELVHENMRGYPLTEAVKYLGRRWSGAEFEEFFVGAESFPEAEREAALWMAGAWAKTRFHEAIGYANEIEDPARRREFLGVVLGSGGLRNSWGISLGMAGEFRESFGAGAEYSDEEVAIALMDGELSKPALSVQRTAARLLMFAPDDGAQWIVSHPRADEVGSHARMLTKKWSDEDPLGASSWLAALEPSSARDFAAAGLVEAVVQSDPAAAFDWAATIQLPEQRAHALDSAFRSWRWSDPDGAAAALDGAELTEVERARLLDLEVKDGQ